jgi:hypothetical protein
VGQLISLFGILLLLTFLKALSFKQLPIYLHQYTVESSALGMFKYQRAILLGSKGRYLYYLSSISVKKVLIKLALYNRTYYFC